MSMTQQADWSDRFFRFVPACQAASEFYRSEEGDDDLEAMLLPTAHQFLEGYPECPYSATWLARDFGDSI